MKSGNGLKPIRQSEIPEWVNVALRAHRSATRKKRAELRRLGLPMIIWENNKVRAIPA